MTLQVHVHSERNVEFKHSDESPVEMSPEWQKVVTQYAIGSVAKSEMMAWEVEIRIPMQHTIESVSSSSLAEAAMLSEDGAGFDYAYIMVDPEPLTMTMRVYANDAPTAITNATSMLGWEPREKCKVMACNPAPVKSPRR